MIIFKKIRWKNFLSTGNQFTEIDLISSKTTILSGESGSGKSTLLDAITFALFNKPFRGVNKAQLINSLNNKDCLVEIEFSINNTDYQINRGIKPNIFEIIKNGQLIDQEANSRDYQEILEKNILKCNFKTFSQIAVLGAVNFVPFMQLKTQERRFIIEELLDLQIFSVMNTLLKKKLSDIKISKKDRETEISIVKNALNAYNDILEKLELDNKKEIITYENKINEILKTLDDNDKLILDIDDKKEKLKIPSDVYQKLNEGSNKIIKALAQIETNHNRKIKELSLYENNSNCPQCHQVIDEEFKKNVLEEIKKELIELNSNKQKALDAQNKMLEKKKKIEQIESKIKILESEKTKLLLESGSLKKNIQYFKNEIVKLSSTDSEKISSTKDKIEELLKKESTISTELKELSVEFTNHETVQVIIDDTGIKSKIIKQYLPVMNKYIALFLEEMQFYVGFTLNENFEESILTAGKDIFSYGNFSEGEKQRLDLALLFTWRVIAKVKNSIHTNLLIMDEIFDSYLDQEATENVIQLLKGEHFQNTNIFVISHKTTISDHFDNTINFTKNKNFSIISS